MSYKMKGSPLLKDVKKWDANGDQIIVNDSTLSNPDMDDFGNETIRYNYIDKSGNETYDILYENKPRGEDKKWQGGPKTPSDRPIDPPQHFA